MEGDGGGQGRDTQICRHIEVAVEGLLSSARFRPTTPSTQNQSEHQGGEGGRTPQPTHFLPVPLFQLQPRPQPPFCPDSRSSHHQGHFLPPDSGSRSDGWTPRLEQAERGGGRGRGGCLGSGPQNKYLQLCQLPLPLPSSEASQPLIASGADGLGPGGQPCLTVGAPGQGFPRRAESLNLFQVPETEGQGPSNCPWKGPKLSLTPQNPYLQNLPWIQPLLTASAC